MKNAIPKYRSHKAFFPEQSVNTSSIADFYSNTVRSRINGPNVHVFGNFPFSTLQPKKNCCLVQNFLLCKVNKNTL